MMKAVSYIIPVMMNFVFGAILFITVQRFTDAGVSKFITGLPLTAWALIYGILNPIIGKFANEKNSARFIVASGILTVISAAGFQFVPALYAQFVWMSLLGVAFALYCPAMDPACHEWKWSMDQEHGNPLFEIIRPE